MSVVNKEKIAYLMTLQYLFQTLNKTVFSSWTLNKAPWCIANLYLKYAYSQRNARQLPDFHNLAASLLA